MLRDTESSNFQTVVMATVFVWFTWILKCTLQTGLYILWKKNWICRVILKFWRIVWHHSGVSSEKSRSTRFDCTYSIGWAIILSTFECKPEVSRWIFFRVIGKNVFWTNFLTLANNLWWPWHFKVNVKIFKYIKYCPKMRSEDSKLWALEHFEILKKALHVKR